MGRPLDIIPARGVVQSRQLPSPTCPVSPMDISFPCGVPDPEIYESDLTHAPCQFFSKDSGGYHPITRKS